MNEMLNSLHLCFFCFWFVGPSWIWLLCTQILPHCQDHLKPTMFPGWTPSQWHELSSQSLNKLTAISVIVQLNTRTHSQWFGMNSSQFMFFCLVDNIVLKKKTFWYSLCTVASKWTLTSLIRSRFDKMHTKCVQGVWLCRRPAVTKMLHWISTPGILDPVSYQITSEDISFVCYRKLSSGVLSDIPN